VAARPLPYGAGFCYNGRRVRARSGSWRTAMEEKVFDVSMIYIQNTSAGNYSLEFYCRNKNVKLNYSNVEGIELIAKVPVEVKSSFTQLAEHLPKVWNMKLGYPTNFKISYSGRITIESM
jgi:hypothetical protein